MLNIVIMGPQGSGKGTQARLLSKNLGLSYIEVGQKLRERAKADSDEGKWVAEMLESGKLFPTSYINDLIAMEFLNPDNETGVILDGFPRKYKQLEYLDEMLSQQGETINVVVYLTLDEEESIARLLDRITSIRTGNVYNWKTNPPPKDEEPYVRLRTDESREAIKTRLELYHENTEPLLEFYKERGLLETIDASESIGVVYNEIIERLRKRELI